MLVQATDGRFYEKALVYYNGITVLIGDDVQVAIPQIFDAGLARKTAVAATSDFLKMKSECHEAKLMIFTMNFGYCYIDSYWWYADIIAPIPIPESFGNVFSDPVDMELNIGFESTFPLQVIIDTMTGAEMDMMLCKALVGDMYYKKGETQTRAQICKALYQQFPYLRGVTKDTSIDQWPIKVRVKWRKPTGS